MSFLLSMPRNSSKHSDCFNTLLFVMPHTYSFDWLDRSDFNVSLLTYKDLHTASPTSSTPLTLSPCLSLVPVLYHVQYDGALLVALCLHNSLSPSSVHLFSHIFTELRSNFCTANFTLLIVVWRSITLFNFDLIIYQQNQVLNCLNVR